MAILVTGGAGFIGSHAVRRLVASGEKIVVLDDMDYGHRGAIVDDSVVVVEGNIGDPKLVEGIFTDHAIEAVMHFAAYTQVGESMTEPLKYYRNNIAAPLTILESMQKHGTRRLIFSSTAATYGNPNFVPMTEAHDQAPINPYGVSKWMLERVIKDCEQAWGLRHVIFRYFNVSGCSDDLKTGEDHDPETHLIPRALMAILGKVPPLTVFGTDYPTPDGTCIRDYVHVLDLAEAHARGLEHLRENGASLACNLGTGKGLSVLEVIRLAEEVTGRKVPHSFGPRRAGDPPELVADASYATTALGFRPQRLDPRLMVESTWRWLTAEHGGRYPR
jgi:UDP-glucose 4-epimerase